MYIDKRKLRCRVGAILENPIDHKIPVNKSLNGILKFADVVIIIAVKSKFNCKLLILIKVKIPELWLKY